jgi:hypothetical protein
MVYEVRAAREIASPPGGTLARVRDSQWANDRVARTWRDEFPDQIQRVTLAGEIVLDAAQHHRGAKTGAGANLVVSQPHSALDAAIEPAMRIVRGHVASEGEAHVSALFFRDFPEIHADKVVGLEAPCSFFERLADHRRDELFPAFDMSGRLIEDEPLPDALFHQQKAAVAFHDGGDCEIGS